MHTLKFKSGTWKPYRYAGIFSSLKSRWCFSLQAPQETFLKTLTIWYSAWAKQILKETLHLE